jgi:hypothetical protein
MLSSTEFVYFVTQTLPVALIILYFLYPESFQRVSEHPLGKLIAILLIALYSYQDIIHGIFICLLVIVYYHQKVEDFISESGINYVEHLPTASEKEESCIFDNNVEKDFTSVEEAYPSNLKPIKKVGESLFRKENCARDSSQIMFKGQTVKNNLVTHVYPEFQFHNTECNPCDRTCHFSIQKKQEIEETLQLPKSSNESVLWEMISSLTSSNEEPVVIYKNQVATML